MIAKNTSPRLIEIPAAQQQQSWTRGDKYISRSLSLPLSARAPDTYFIRVVISFHLHPVSPAAACAHTHTISPYALGSSSTAAHSTLLITRLSLSLALFSRERIYSTTGSRQQQPHLRRANYKTS